MSPQEAWEQCNRPDWMLWALEELGYPDQRVSREFACWCVRQVWELLTDPRSRTAVEVAERYARGEATAAELSAAEDAAWGAARAAAWGAAEDAARAAAWAAAWDAAWAAARAAARAAAEGAARAAARAAQANRLREVVPWSEVRRLIDEHLAEHGDAPVERKPMTDEERKELHTEVFGGF